MFLLLLALACDPKEPPDVWRDAKGKRIATVVCRHDGRLQLRDARGRTLGYYYEDRNVTRDARGRLVGRGNLLSSLLRQ